ncbi:hypothetical protein ZYGR_0P00800 [Zygosaccharomyces rouxii]|uniref:Alpha-1,2 mannosyltransferase KTR1 n=1 Tax=Zygosaccharomyces rouxii TaxID=4956 RepID=A0A1Q3A168_ZYGRO|nr:hypothetical protein ZYGR_0P00800 [Zygosaccharomyces rouxii]
MKPAGDRRRLNRLLGYAAIALITIYVLYKGAQRNGNGFYGSSAATRQVEKDGNIYRELVSSNNGALDRSGLEKATFVTLVRNSDLYGLIPSIKSVEDRFNHKYGYDWVFLNDEPFTEEFINVTSALVTGETKYGLIEKKDWDFPPWIDQNRAAGTRDRMGKEGIIYGNSISYRFMCRYESGLFYRHPIFNDYEWYWRVEPDVKLHCDVNYDVFKFMRENNKKYGFTISIKEYSATIETLWDATLSFLEKHPEHVNKNCMLDFISDDGGSSYNLCHFWSNFEIASLDLWRSDAYRDYFDFLDQWGGFFYERWGDAPVHSIAASLFLDRDEIHHFGDFGYFHVPFHQCPVDDETRLSLKCDCNPNEDFTWHSYSCTTKYYTVNQLRKPSNWLDHATS